MFVLLSQCGHRFVSSDELNAVNNYNLIDELVPSIRNVLSPSDNSDDSSKSPLLYYNGYRFNSIVKVEEDVTSDKIILMIGTSMIIQSFKKISSSCSVLYFPLLLLW